MESPEQLRKRLTPLQWQVTQEKGTERAFTSELYENKAAGSYTCIVCKCPLFSSDSKFNSGTGWPSFYQAEQPSRITNHSDRTHGIVRTEVTCSNCNAHLGHMFEDGPRPTGLRYCINGASLGFSPSSS